MNTHDNWLLLTQYFWLLMIHGKVINAIVDVIMMYGVEIND